MKAIIPRYCSVCGHRDNKHGNIRVHSFPGYCGKFNLCDSCIAVYKTQSGLKPLTAIEQLIRKLYEKWRGRK